MSRPATSRLKVNPAIGSPPVLQYCSPDQLEVDPVYQRSLESDVSLTLIRRIAMYWDWGLCQPLVVARRGSGALFVVDGQHRLAAAKLRGDIQQLPCVVASYRSAADEAAAFVSLNKDRRALTQLAIFKAELAAGDEAAVAVARLVRQAGLELAPHENRLRWKPGCVGNVRGMADCWRRYGEAIVRTALCTMAHAFQGQPLRYGGTIFRGLVGFLAEEARARRKVDQPLMIMVMEGAAQNLWMAEFKLEMAASGAHGHKAATLVVGNAYREALREASEEAA